MPYDSFLTQFHQCRQGFADHLIQVGKLNVVHVNQVDEVDVQPFHAFVDAFRCAFGGIVPGIDSVFPVSSHFG